MCNTDITIGNSPPKDWKQVNKKRLTNFTSIEKCVIKLTKEGKVSKASKTVVKKTQVARVPKTLSKTPFDRAVVIYETPEAPFAKKEFKGYEALDFFIRGKADKIMVINAKYSSQGESARVVIVCKEVGKNCSINMEYGDI